MNMLINATPNQMMSSREIADLCQKRHDNVMQVIRDLIAGQILTPEIQESTFEHRGNSYKCFLLNKRDSLVTVARLSPEFTAAVVDRWQELEVKQADPMAALSDPSALRGLLLGYTEKVIALEHQVETLTPKAMALDQIADTTSLFTIRQTAKMIKMKERDLVSLVLNRGWAYRDRRDVLQPYADATARGYVTAVMTAPVKQASGEEKVFTQLRITAKGVTRLSYLAAKGIAA